MSWFTNWMHPQKGYEDAQNQLNQYYGQAQNYLSPYANEGQSMYPGLASQQNALLSPGALENQWINSYQESPYAKQLQQQAQSNGLNAASSMGLLGSSSAINAIQGGTTAIGNADRQQYLNDLMQKYMAGAGIGENIYGAGANAAGNMGQNAMQQGQNSAQMAYGAGNAQGNLFGSLLANGIGGGLANMFGSGNGSGGSQWGTSSNYAPVSAASSAAGGGFL